ncbi:MAG: 7,8-didemethyl-8-hydroxy-5-deazariboflavin synthase, CofH subunit [Symbiobacteriaceae bacterium]|jgi:cyclic dehypoxanthinyl futalosine synthase|nr:7,8-didemethyl-8-hydroxy-5-deazariboflavin synthase, CofH subunit [Symbiobacteriaceae bacterium]
MDVAATLSTDIRPILDRRLAGGRLSLEETVALLKSNDLLALGQAADVIRKQLHPNDEVSFIIDRNINYTNVCVAQCSFCAFKRDVGHEEGYTLDWHTIDQKCQELVDQGGTQVLLQGGLNPALKLPYYQELISHIQTRFPQLMVHGFSPAEIFYLSKLSKLSVMDTLRELQAAGLRTIPGGGGEILVDRVRRIIGKGKVLTDQWFAVMEAAQQLGMNTTATMMYGHIETVEERAESLIRIRDSGDKYGGYRSFIHWDFQPENTELGEQVLSNPEYRLGDGFDYLKLMAVARLVLDNCPNLQVSWVTQGPKMAQVALRFGGNDFGGTMMEENVVSAAGTTYMVGPAKAVELIKAAGFKPVKRDTFYNVLHAY